ncbi:MAG: YiiD C-terminal domain-containing protein [Myxococcota bacterium]|nr:YiiD C-terminal domain-containing protein [Myxococcota bacterium]
MSKKSGMSLEARMEESLREQFPLYDFFGLEVQSVHGGVYRCSVPHRRSNLNHIDTIHAGIQWSAAEVLGGMVMISTLQGLSFFAVVKRVSIDFKRPARSAIIAEAVFDDAFAERLKSDFETRGEASFSLEVSLRDEDGVEVASAVGDYLARKPRTS